MHYVGYYDLAAAVSNAGGLGIITALTQATPEDLRREIRKCKALTNKPFGCNLTLLPVTVNPDYEGYCKVIIEEGVPVVETAGRNPGKYIKLFHDAGIIVIHKCVAIRHALTAIKQGADMISMDGFECAGHPGSFFTCPGRYQHLLLLTSFDHPAMRRRGGHWKLGVAGESRTCFDRPIRGFWWLRNGFTARCRDCSRCRRRQHGHALHGHQRSPNSRQY